MQHAGCAFHAEPAVSVFLGIITMKLVGVLYLRSTFPIGCEFETSIFCAASSASASCRNEDKDAHSYDSYATTTTVPKQEKAAEWRSEHEEDLLACTSTEAGQ